jgi:hypothetical protein
VIRSTAGTLIYNLEMVSKLEAHGIDVHTMAVIFVPSGPVTATQPPQLPELSQFESDNAVP